MRYFVNGYEVTRWYMAQYIVSQIGGDPEIVISSYEQAASNYFMGTGEIYYNDYNLGISIKRCY